MSSNVSSNERPFQLYYVLLGVAFFGILMLLKPEKRAFVSEEKSIETLAATTETKKKSKFPQKAVTNYGSTSEINPVADKSVNSIAQVKEDKQEKLNENINKGGWSSGEEYWKDTSEEEEIRKSEGVPVPLEEVWVEYQKREVE